MKYNLIASLFFIHFCALAAQSQAQISISEPDPSFGFFIHYNNDGIGLRCNIQCPLRINAISENGVNGGDIHPRAHIRWNQAKGFSWDAQLVAALYSNMPAGSTRLEVSAHHNGTSGQQTISGSLNRIIPRITEIIPGNDKINLVINKKFSLYDSKTSENKQSKFALTLEEGSLQLKNRKAVLAIDQDGSIDITVKGKNKSGSVSLSPVTTQDKINRLKKIITFASATKTTLSTKQ